jgi:hypothetical protein
MIDDDLPEYIGTSKGELAAPKGKRAPITPAPTFNQHPQIDGLEDEPAAPVNALAEEMASPAPRVAVYNPPAEGASHPRHAVLGPALRVDRAEHALNGAALELTKATRHLRACELAESEAETIFLSAVPGPTPDELLREHVAAEAKRRADRVASGESPDERAIIVHGKSELDRVASHRARPAPGQATSLRSSVVRRGIA